MSEKKNKKENEKMINVDEESTENVKMKKIVKKILEEERESRYDDVRNRRREEFECRDFHEILYRWHDDDLEQLYKREELGKKQEREFRENEEEKDKWVNSFSLFDVYINRF